MVHTLRLDNYSPTPRKLVLGTNSSYGTESIKIERGAGWDGLNLTATWHIPGREEPLRVALLDGDAMDVPPEVTKEAKDGVLVLAGLASGVQRASCNVDYLILEQAGVYGGADAEPTPELAAQVLEAALQAKADAEAAAEEAAAAKARAEEAQAASAAAKEAAEAAAADAAKAGPYAEAARAALAAEESKATANAAANLAGENATAAQQAAENAAAAANYAGQSASDAAASKAAAEIAAQAAQEAQAAAAAARDDAVKAQTAAQTAAKSAQDAQAAAEKARDDAKAAQKGAEDARDAAAGSAEAAAKSEENAKQSADTLAESVENVAANTAAVAELKENKAEIDDTAVGANAWSSKHIVDMLCPPLEESGNPVVCYPVAGYPLGVKAKWEPMQEGSGTPYPAGGGKNLFNPAWMSEKEVSYGVTWTITPDGTVTANGTTDSTAYYNSDYFSLPAGTYTISAMPRFRISITNRDAGNTLVASQSVGKPCTFAVENDIQKATLFFSASGTLDNVSAKPKIEKGATATDYAPYENIRPIKGRDSVAVERCGENLVKFPYSTASAANKNGLVFTSQQDGSITVDGTATADTWYLVEGGIEKRLPMNTPITLSGCPAGGSIGSYYIGLYLGGKWFTDAGNGNKNIKFTTRGIASRVEISITQGTVCNSLTFYPKIEVGTTITPYSKYQGSTNTLTLPETVYEGEVDAVSGEGKETWKMLTLDGTTNKFTQSDRFWRMQSNTAPGVVNGYFTMCSHFPANTFGGNQTVNYIFTRADIMSRYFPDVNALNTYIAAQYAAGTPVQICYKLAKPVSFTATGAQPIPAIAGVNTVLTDADSATVTGRADPIKRITDLEDAVASQT